MSGLCVRAHLTLSVCDASVPLCRSESAVVCTSQVAYFYDAEVGNFYYGQVNSSTLPLRLLCQFGFVLRAWGALRLAHTYILSTLLIVPSVRVHIFCDRAIR